MRLNIVITYESLTFEPKTQNLRTRNLYSTNSQLEFFEFKSRIPSKSVPNSHFRLSFQLLTT